MRRRHAYEGLDRPAPSTRQLVLTLLRRKELPLRLRRPLSQLWELAVPILFYGLLRWAASAAEDEHFPAATYAPSNMSEAAATLSPTTWAPLMLRPFNGLSARGNGASVESSSARSRRRPTSDSETLYADARGLEDAAAQERRPGAGATERGHMQAAHATGWCRLACAARAPGGARGSLAAAAELVTRRRRRPEFARQSPSINSSSMAAVLCAVPGLGPGRCAGAETATYVYT